MNLGAAALCFFCLTSLASAASLEPPASGTKLDPIVAVPPSTNIREGIWKATQEYGAVRYTRGAKPDILSADPFKKRTAPVPEPAAAEPQAAEPSADAASAPPLALPPAEPAPQKTMLRELLSKGAALPPRPEDASAAAMPEPEDRQAPDASVKPVLSGQRESLPAMAGLPARERTSDFADLGGGARPAPQAPLRDRFQGLRQKLSALPAIPLHESSAQRGDVELEDGGLLHDAMPDLIAMLKADSPRLRARAADELGRRGAEAAAAVPALGSALEDDHYRVRASAALALGNIGGEARKLRPLLAPLLKDKNPDVRMSAQTALSRLK